MSTGQRDGSASEAAQQADAVDDGKLDDIDREPFFATSDDSDLTFVHQEKTSEGSTSRFDTFRQD